MSFFILSSHFILLRRDTERLPKMSFWASQGQHNPQPKLHSLLLKYMIFYLCQEKYARSKKTRVKQLQLLRNMPV